MSNRDPNGPPFGPGGGQPGYPGYPGGYPMSPFMPMIIRDGPNQQPAQPQDPPLRVQMAAMLMNHMTRKTTAQVAATEHSIEVVPGQKLTEEEEGTRATALNMLSYYFSGKLEPDVWEKESLRNLNGVPVMEFRCVCTRADQGTNADCPFCAGTGMMDIVLRQPKRAAMDADGNVTVQGASGITRHVDPSLIAATNQPPQGSPPQGRQRPPRTPG